MSSKEIPTITRLFSRQTSSSTITTPITTPSTTPSQAGSRSRANSYDLKCYHELSKEYELSGNLYNLDTSSTLDTEKVKSKN